jgi:hypothetical protein
MKRALRSYGRPAFLLLTLLACVGALPIWSGEAKGGFGVSLALGCVFAMSAAEYVCNR